MLPGTLADESSSPPVAPKERDQDLLDRIRQRDFSAFEELVDRYEGKVYALGLKLTGNPDDAEEVAQEVFLTLYQKLDQFRGESLLSSWIYRITANAAFMKLRDRRKRSTVEYREAAADPAADELPEVIASFPRGDWSQAADERMERGELKARIDQAIAELPDRFKLIFLLKDVQGLSNEEIGEIVNMTVPAVKSRLHRARLFLRERLQRHLEEEGVETRPYR